MNEELLTVYATTNIFRLLASGSRRIHAIVLLISYSPQTLASLNTDIKRFRF